ncbi:hypothetical protein [Telmatospirillum sp.]|uniref:hypothetical protein n=1 Tax=Telmatospirillum sp. TaxID=2079197 RepID=UPI00283F7737|nr:hypothetical protein [Telmatospirillum sp.]MDR3435310.1 hypothetical protein [Telmatospirillum sp.]
MQIPYDLAPPVALSPSSDLAQHFLECGALNTNISLAPGKRLVITDDLLNGTIVDMAALSMAVIVSRDSQVARAAMIPLSLAANSAGPDDRLRFERLFQLIEESAFDPEVRVSADTLIAARFRETEIRVLVEELGGVVGPARVRYRAFLDIVRMLVDKRISGAAFLDEFIEFTRVVAGKLDFGIYSMCVDRLFGSDNIPMPVKAFLLKEVLRFPTLVRKELLTNLLSSSSAPGELVRYARTEMAGMMNRDQLTEIFLFTTLKLAWQAQGAIARSQDKFG